MVYIYMNTYTHTPERRANGFMAPKGTKISIYRYGHEHRHGYGYGHLYLNQSIQLNWWIDSKYENSFAG